MTLKNNRTPLPYAQELCVSFHSHSWYKIGVIVLKRSNRSQIMAFRPMGPCYLTDDLIKTIGHLFYTTSSFEHHFVAICEFKLELRPGNAPNWGNVCFNLCDLPWCLTSDLCMNITAVNDNYDWLTISWRCVVRNIVTKVRPTDVGTIRRTDRTVHRATWSQLKINCKRNILKIVLTPFDNQNMTIKMYLFFFWNGIHLVQK